jgi:hypothetical protein
MSKTRRWQGLCLAGLGLALAGSAGCQTWVGGMTLPSGHYLEHRPQYFPPDPDFPLQRELTTMEAQNSLAIGNAVNGAPPAPAPGIAPGVPGGLVPSGR